jgi:uncharacterized membrane protein YfcA
VSPGRLRTLLLVLLVVAAVVSVVGKKADSPWIGWLSFAIFICAVAVYFRWRRSVRGRVFDREAKTQDETRARPDQ